MARYTRALQKIFGGSASNIGNFGSAAAGSPVSGASPTLVDVQSLAQFVNGWSAATLGASKFPALEDMNALDYLFSSQLAYILQQGIPEYSSTTTYFQYNIVVKPLTYELYGSLIDTNVGNALPAAVSDANWIYLGNLSSIATTGNVSTAETSSLDGQMYVASGLTGKILKKVGSSGYPKLTSGVPAYSATIPLTDLATQAANTALVNATAGAAAPTALALAASTVLGRASTGNAVALTLLGLAATSGVLSIASGNALQAPVISATSTYASISGNIPFDNTIPQVGEGTEIFSAAITPLSASSDIEFDLSALYGVGSSGQYVTVAIYVNGGANAIYATTFTDVNAGTGNFIFKVASGSTSARTYSVRIGAPSGNIDFNGALTAAKYGGVNSSRFKVTEKLA